MNGLLQLRNAQAVRADSVPRLSVEEFREAVICAVEGGARLSAMFGRPAEGNRLLVTAVLANDPDGTLQACSTVVDGGYDSITPDCPQAHWFEREIAEQWGVRPQGHPWLKPVRFQPPCRPAAGQPPAAERPVIGVTDFFRVEGHEIHEVAVGPVHAGVIEPGHFRFQCFGENVLHLEISLGYQHRGVERAMIGGPTARSSHYMETLAGDTTIGHATAYCQLLEALSGSHVPARAEVLRGVALELERVANHVGDLGALAGDVGFLPTLSYCGRIRGDVLNLTAMLCGNRFGRGMVRPGGVGFDMDSARVEELLKRLAVIAKDTAISANLLWDTPSVQARFEGAGTVSRELAEQIGLVGPAARACGLERDIQNHHPSGIYRFAHIPLSGWDSGDVFARAYVRWLEIQRSLAFVSEQLRSLPEDVVMASPSSPAGNRFAVSMVEGWRGEICHVAVTDDRGRLAAYKVADPSFHNWFGLACALRNQPISDFPLCNKSFNLSYCGHDL
ncbi:MAG: NADH-quinone oxidoreductase subunit C [Planctomycetes bacterium]|nr:NADH-quinone oxidoreductase subunit C [Planctomycetota bacterium]